MVRLIRPHARMGAGDCDLPGVRRQRTAHDRGGKRPGHRRRIIRQDQNRRDDGLCDSDVFPAGRVAESVVRGGYYADDVIFRDRVFPEKSGCVRRGVR